MNDLDYWTDKYFKEYNDTRKEDQEAWLKYFFYNYTQLRMKYEELSSRPPPDACELIGEIRERRLIVSFLNNKSKNLSHPDEVKIYEEIANSINSGEYF